MKLDAFVRSPTNYDVNEASDAAGLDCGPDSLTQQNFKEECDINTIVKRFGVTGQVNAPIRAPSYGDYTGIQDYKTAMDTLAAARDAFYELPSQWRTKFDNDPQRLLEFVSDDKNRAEAEKMGLVFPKPAGGGPAGPPSPSAPPPAAPGNP